MDTGEHWALGAEPWERSQHLLSLYAHLSVVSLPFLPPPSSHPPFCPRVGWYLLSTRLRSFPRTHRPHLANLPASAARLEPVTLHLCGRSPVGPVQKRRLIKDCRPHGTPCRSWFFSVQESWREKQNLSKTAPPLSLAWPQEQEFLPILIYSAWLRK